jgi:hypothetical protein
MIKDALQYLVGLDRPEERKIGDRTYTTKTVYAVEAPEPEAIEMTTLTGLVDYIQNNPDGLDFSGHIVHVMSPSLVALRTQLYGEFDQRATRVEAKAVLPDFPFREWLPVADFIPMAYSTFLETEDLTTILKVVGNIKTESGVHAADDGVTQTVTAKTGIARVEDGVAIKNPVLLRPYRTFPDIEQPKSAFVVRLKDDLRVKLFEADGGVWRNAAIRKIHDHLSHELNDFEGLSIVA